MLTSECLCFGIFFYRQSKKFGQEAAVYKVMPVAISSLASAHRASAIHSDDALAVSFREVEG